MRAYIIARAALLWALTALFATLLATPIASLWSGGGIGYVVAALMAIFLGSSIAAAATLTHDLWSGRYDGGQGYRR